MRNQHQRTRYGPGEDPAKLESQSFNPPQPDRSHVVSKLVCSAAFNITYALDTSVTDADARLVRIFDILLAEEKLATKGGHYEDSHLR